MNDDYDVIASTDRSSVNVVRQVVEGKERPTSNLPQLPYSLLGDRALGEPEEERQNKRAIMILSKYKVRSLLLTLAKDEYFQLLRVALKASWAETR